MANTGGDGEGYTRTNDKGNAGLIAEVLDVTLEATQEVTVTLDGNVSPSCVTAGKRRRGRMGRRHRLVPGPGHVITVLDRPQLGDWT